MMTKVWPGKPYPVGATWDGAGVNFSIFSENATGVDLCLFDWPGGNNEIGKNPCARKYSAGIFTTG